MLQITIKSYYNSYKLFQNVAQSFPKQENIERWRENQIVKIPNQAHVDAKNKGNNQRISTRDI